MQDKPIRILVIQPDGSGQPQEVGRQDLATLQGIVGGYLQAVPALFNPEGIPQALIWCNDDGKNQHMPINHRATALWWALDPDMRGHDHLCGTVFISGGPDEDSDIRTIPDVIEQVWASVTGMS
ncbi:MAG: DUF3846 domain-containing protein [Caldilineaceae bacterium]|nr:DUF3846 domain-containing protein [Caldilineaceae bacterium]